jgi:hypothetical protein
MASEPATMTEELFVELCDRVAGGSSLLKLEKEPGFPSRSAMRRYIAADEERSRLYEQARQDRADYRVEMMDAIVGSVSTGKIDPASARVMIDTIKWQASKEKPKSYGDKVELHGKDGAALFPELVVTYGAVPGIPAPNADGE